MADINLLSTQSTLPQFAELEREFGSIIKGLVKTRHHGLNTASGARYNLFGTLKNGTQMLIDQLVEQLTNVRVYLNTKLISVERGSAENWQLKTTNGQLEANAIVFALPSRLAAQTLKELDPALSNALTKIESSNSVVVNLLYNTADIGKPHKGFGFVIPSTERKKIIAAGFISQKFSRRASGNYEMIRVFIGGQLAPDLFSLSDNELVNLAQNEISPYLGTKGPAVKTWLSRWPNGLPYYQLDHKKTVEHIENLSKNHLGFFFTGSSYNGLGIPDCVCAGEKTAALIATHIQQRKLQCLNQAV